LEHRAYENIRAAKTTVAALEQLSTDNEVWIPRGTSIFEAVSMILLRGDVLRIKLNRSADLLLAALRSKCKGKIHGHHLTAPVTITIEKNGAVKINEKTSG
jgi:transcriptional regulator